MPQRIISHVGEKRIMNCGLEAEIIESVNNGDINVRFCNGKIVKHRTYQQFRNGNIFCPGEKHTHPWQSKASDRVGQKHMMNCGLEAEIIAYRHADDIDIRFSDGTVLEHTFWRNFIKGMIRPQKTVWDHLGNEYLSIKDMCKHYNVNPSTFQNRIGSGYTLKEALCPDKYINQRRDRFFEYGGVVYKSLADFANKNNLNYNRLIKLHMHHGEDAIHLLLQEKASGYDMSRHVNQSDNRIGEEVYQSCGLKAVITDYKEAHNIDIEFEDGTAVKNKAYKDFKKGKIGHPYLSNRGITTCFHGYKVKYICSSGGRAYYEATNVLTGGKEIISPQEIIRRNKEYT